MLDVLMLYCPYEAVVLKNYLSLKRVLTVFRKFVFLFGVNMTMFYSTEIKMHFASLIVWLFPNEYCSFHSNAIKYRNIAISLDQGSNISFIDYVVHILTFGIYLCNPYKVCHDFASLFRCVALQNLVNSPKGYMIKPSSEIDYIWSNL